MRYLRDLSKKSLIGKIALVRIDLNVKNTKDNFRIELSLPTIRLLLRRGARVVIMSHFGRPAVGVFDKSLSLKMFLPALERRLKQKIVFLSVVPKHLPPGKLFLLENLRFFKGEEKDDPGFARALAALGTFYVNEAFAVSHRANASVSAITRYLPAYVGLLLEREMKNLSYIMKSPRQPLVAIVGGAKIDDKLPMIRTLLLRSKAVLLGSSIIDRPVAGLKSKKFVRPLDWIEEGGRALDIGPLTIEDFIKRIAKAKTIIWNGPVGNIEKKKFFVGSIAIARAIARSKGFSVVGGGETAQMVTDLGLAKKMGFVSSGGGAMIEFLSGKKLPGIKALEKQ